MESLNFYLCASYYQHPDITEGQHTNGNPNLFVRKFGTNDWYLVDRGQGRTVHRVRMLVGEIGIDRFITEHCIRAEVR